MLERAPASSHRSGPRRDARRTARLVGAGLLLLLALWMIQSYLIALGWAAIIAISVWPLYRRLQALLGGSRIVAPLLVTAALAVLLLFPVALVLTEIGREGQLAMQWLTELQRSGVPVPGWVHGLPLVGQQLDIWWQAHLARPQSVEEMLKGIDSETVTGWSKTLGGALLSDLFHAFLTFLTLFILLRGGEHIGAHALAAIDRWFGDPGETLAERMAAAVRGTVNGTLLIAVGEGILIGIGYRVAGVPNAALFAVLTTAFAMLPFGAWFAFTAAAIVLVLTGGTIITAAAIVGWGAVVMLIGDNIIQPALIGGAVRLPFLWTLLGILGGLETFGLIGLFLGPVVMAALLTIWRQQSGSVPERTP